MSLFEVHILLRDWSTPDQATPAFMITVLQLLFSNESPIAL